MTDHIENLRLLVNHLTEQGESGAVSIILDTIAEIERLREILNRRHIDPDRCNEFPKGEQCALKAGHKGGHKWARGD